MTKHTSTRLVGLLVVAGLILTAGCTPPPKKRQFNNLLSRLNQDLAEAGRGFYATLTPYSAGATPPQGAPRTALEGCKTALTKVQEVFDDTYPPRGSITGIAYRAAYAKYLEAQRRILEECFTECVTVAETKNLTPQEKWAKIQPLLRSASRIEKEAHDKLMEAQSEFSQAHNYRTI